LFFVVFVFEVEVGQTKLTKSFQIKKHCSCVFSYLSVISDSFSVILSEEVEDTLVLTPSDWLLVIVVTGLRG
jgi:hypothetical protein